MSDEMNNIQIRACRVCFNSECPENIFLDAGGAWLRMYEYCFGLSINDDDISRKLCSVCANTMKKFAKFKRQCHKSHRLWKSLMSEKSKYRKSAYKIEVKLESIKNDLKNWLKKEENVFPQIPRTDLIGEKDEDTYIEENDSFLVHVKNENDDNSIYNDENFDVLGTKNKDDNHFDNNEVNTVDVDNDIIDNIEKRSSKKTNPDKRLKRSYNNKLQCKVCKKIYKHKQSLLKHTQKRTCQAKKKTAVIDLPICPIFHCGICDMTSHKSDVINKHLEEHRTNNDLNCKTCDFKGRDFADMLTHRFSHHPNEHKKVYSEVKRELINNDLNNLLKKENGVFFQIPSTDLTGKKAEDAYIEENEYLLVHAKNENDANDEYFDVLSTNNEDDNNFDDNEVETVDVDNNDVNDKVEKIGSKKNNPEKRLKRSYNNKLQCKVCKKIYKHKQSFLKHTQKGTCKSKKKTAEIDLPICPIFHCVISHPSNRNTNASTFHTAEIDDGVQSTNTDALDSRSTSGICDMTSSESDVINKHLEEHRSNNDLNCKTCDFKGRDFADMVTHRFSHHPSEYKKVYSCHVCNRRSPAPLPLQFHYRSTHLKKNGGMCTVCNKIFRVYKLWRNHERLHKEETNKYICDHCGKECLFRHEIKLHLASHFNIRTFICDTCGKRFKQLRGLKHHMASAHVTNPIKCTHCNKTFKHKFSLESHMKLLGGDKPFKCEVCSKCFSSTWYLKSHMFWHTGERPYPCELCNKRFKAKCQLTVHLRRHMGNLPYKCAHCSKCFTTTTQRRVHESVHTGVRAHKCPYCEKSYHCRKVMRVHCKTQHNIDVELSDNKSEAVENK